LLFGVTVSQQWREFDKGLPFPRVMYRKKTSVCQ